MSFRTDEAAISPPERPFKTRKCDVLLDSAMFSPAAWQLSANALESSNVDSSVEARVVEAALRDVGGTLARLPGREIRSGLHEVKELGPALRASLVRVGHSPHSVALNHPVTMSNWNRPTSKVDLVVLEPGRGIQIAAELKAWDIGHQLFDLAKVCCLLAAGVSTGFLICVAERRADFDLLPGGELFPPVRDETRVHDFPALITRHQAEWRKHAGKGGPEPTSIPSAVSTTAAAVDMAIEAYPGHSARAVQVAVTDPTLIALKDGWPS